MTFTEIDKGVEAILEDAAWLRAQTLSERAALLCEAQTERPSTDFDAELAKRRAERWYAQPPFTDDSLLTQRLNNDGLSRAGFLRVLGASPEALRERLDAPPAWLSDMAEAFCDARSSASDGNGDCTQEDDPTATPLGFLAVAAPLIRRALDQLEAGVERLERNYAALPFDRATVTEILFWGFDLPGKLSDKLLRPMILNLNIARLENSLAGHTPEERFRSFLSRLRRPEEALSFLREYPVLARLLSITVNNWLRFGLEFLERLCADWEEIRATLACGSEPGQLAAAKSNAGDTHRQGRSVVIAEFTSGLKLVYKPHSLGVDKHFGELLRWLNERGAHPPLRALRCLDCGTHGWAEFIAAEGRRTVAEVRRFYERQGVTLAQLYALNAVDFHYENLIAAGEHPVMIDLEALFHPREPQSPKPTTLAEELLQSSVMSTGMLPQRVGGRFDEGVELSGLGGAPAQLSPDRLLSIEKPQTDEMRIRMEQFKLEGSQNRPTLGGAEINVIDYVDEIIRGFESGYRLLVSLRDELLADGGPIARFNDDEVRSILRPTRTYALALQDSYHPDVLRDGLDRSRLFDRLWLEVETRPHLARVLKSECEELHSGDIPLFLCRPGSRDLETGTNEVIRDFFDEPLMATVRRRIRQMDEDDLSRQKWFIRAALSSLVGEAGAQTKYRPVKRPSATRLEAEQLLTRARAIGDRIGALALREQDGISWLGLTLVGERFWTLAPVGTDLYEGSAGISLFLAYLGALTREERYTVLARETTAAMLRHYRETLPEADEGTTPIGAFTGCGGVIYTLTHLGVLWDSPALLAEAESIAWLLPEFIDKDDCFDILDGVAGCICVLCGLYRASASRVALTAALQCGERLASYLRNSLREDAAAGVKPSKHKLLTGFSHGAAGMACALLELCALTGEPRFRDAALAAIDYERHLFSRLRGNWPDLRKQNDSGAEIADQGFMVAWCHGAPGIGLARVRSLPHLDDAETRAEIETALATTLREGFGYNHSLCHGDAGNLELLLEAARTMKDDESLKRRLRRTVVSFADSIEQNGWCCGTPLNVEIPGLMTGLAGIGYSLLRLAEPNLVPSVLTLAPPPA